MHAEQMLVVDGAGNDRVLLGLVELDVVAEFLAELVLQDGLIEILLAKKDHAQADAAARAVRATRVRSDVRGRALPTPGASSRGEVVDDDGDVGLLREWSVAVGLGYDVEDAGTQKFPAYSGSITPEHAEATGS